MSVNNFQSNLAKQSKSPNLSADSGYFGGSVDCFLAVAARKLVEDGLTVEQVAYLYTSAVIYMLNRRGGVLALS